MKRVPDGRVRGGACGILARKAAPKGVHSSRGSSSSSRSVLHSKNWGGKKQEGCRSDEQRFVTMTFKPRGEVLRAPGIGRGPHRFSVLHSSFFIAATLSKK